MPNESIEKELLDVRELTDGRDAVADFIRELQKTAEGGGPYFLQFGIRTPSGIDPEGSRVVQIESGVKLNPRAMAVVRELFGEELAAMNNLLQVALGRLQEALNATPESLGIGRSN